MSQQRFKIILNPYAGRWKVKQNIESIRYELNRLDITYDMVTTQAAGEAITLTREAVEEGYKTIVAVGGDSTISEVVNGLVQAGGEGEVGNLGILPFGTANDLAYMLNIPRDLRDACERIAAGKTQLIDVCQVNGHFFDNNSGIGLEPTITLAAEDITQLKGISRYIVAALRSIWQRPHWHAYLEWDNGSYEGPIILISVGNGSRTGGFLLTPDARLDDGLLDFVFAPSMSPLYMLKLFPSTLRGTHIHNKRVIYHRTTYLKVKIDPTPLHADGELIKLDATEIEYSILPKKLRVIV